MHIGDKQGAECGNGYMLIGVKLKLCIMHKIGSVLKLRYSKVQANLRNPIGEVEFDGTWEQFKIAISDAGVAFLGFRNRKHQALYVKNIFRYVLKIKISCTKTLQCPRKNLNPHSKERYHR